jgi:amyloid beta precursor protein binding protein 1
MPVSDQINLKSAFNVVRVIESHSETTPSLRIDKPFPALLQYAKILDFKSMDPTEHGHIPYVVILVRAMLDWKVSVSVYDPTYQASGN